MFNSKVENKSLEEKIGLLKTEKEKIEQKHSELFEAYKELANNKETK